MKRTPVSRTRPRCPFVWEPACTTDRKSTRLNSSHGYISYAVFCLKKKKKDVQMDAAACRALNAQSAVLKICCADGNRYVKGAHDNHLYNRDCTQTMVTFVQMCGDS